MRCASDVNWSWNPSSNMRSASSTTKNVHRSCRSTTCSWMNSIIRPGVATTTSLPAFLSSRAISHFPAPPKTATVPTVGGRAFAELPCSLNSR